ncbi:MAG: 23S rRNA (adenine(2503)-C(2))-methyltransferase RlmN [Chloroflexota bacterium]|nr:23S rRNA (adenine(2503)-C(2))-methyltransferase RlmN [Chloroflexota bacterium]
MPKPDSSPAPGSVVQPADAADGALPLLDLPASGPQDARPGISDASPSELLSWFADRGEAAFRARQLADHVWSGRAKSFDDIHTLPGPLRDALEATYRFCTLTGTERRTADGGLTDKALHTLDDGRVVESVLMRYPARGSRRERTTLCISSQAGCAVGCPFCATGELGLWRDLRTSEIIDQARFWRNELAGEGRRLTNIVFMGMGEPLLNPDAVLAACGALSDGTRFGLGQRHITVSTAGVIPGIERLTDLRRQYKLAISLHTARADLRDVLVPLNRKYPLEGVVAAATDYADATGRRITYEMVMIDRINDTPADARATAELLRGRLAHVNLIPMNPVAHTPWQPSPPDRVEGYASTLRAVGLHTTVRRNRGLDIGAACGQLAAEKAGDPAPAAVQRRRDAIERRSAAALIDMTDRTAQPGSGA